MKATTQAIQDTITEAKQIAVITHIGPDGDALGSLTAVGLYLRSLSKSVTLYCESDVPRRFDFLPLVDSVQRNVPSDADYDLIIAVDCGDVERMGLPYQSMSTPKLGVINIDHHITNTRFGDINVVGETAVSATEVLYEIFAEMGVKINPDLATSLLTGLVTDTLAFRTIGVTGNTLKIAGVLVDAGGQLGLITMQTMTLKSPATLRLWKIGMSKVRFSDGLYWIAISKEDRKKANYMGLGSAGLVNFLADIEDAAMGCVLMEADDGTLRVGFRCRPPFNVAEVAINLGGGGHALAAGCKLDGPIGKAEKMVVAVSKEAIKQQGNE